MKDEDIVALIKRLGYVEGLPVVVDPKILNPKAFIDEGPAHARHAMSIDVYKRQGQDAVQLVGDGLGLAELDAGELGLQLVLQRVSTCLLYTSSP